MVERKIQKASIFNKFFSLALVRARYKEPSMYRDRTNALRLYRDRTKARVTA